MSKRNPTFGEMNEKLLPLPGVEKSPQLIRRVMYRAQVGGKGTYEELWEVQITGYWTFCERVNSGQWIDLHTGQYASMASAVDHWNQLVESIISAANGLGKNRNTRKGESNV